MESNGLSCSIPPQPLDITSIIPCRVSVWMPETLKNTAIVEKYKEMVDVLYTEPDGCAILGSFLRHDMGYPSGETSTSSRRTEINNSPVKKV